MKAIKILQLIPAVEEKKGIGGAEVILLTLLKKINKDRFKFVIAYPPDAPLTDHFKRENAEVVPFSTKSKFDIAAINKLIRLIKTRDIDIIHSHQMRLDFLGSVISKFTKIPLVITRHQPTTQFPIKGFFKYIYLFIDKVVTVKFSDKIIAVSRAVADDLVTGQGAESSKVRVIYAGLDIEKYEGIECGAIRKALNINFDIPLVGIIARIYPPKGHQYFLKAAKEVLREIPETKFLIVGDGPLRKQCEDLAEELDISSSVIFMGFRRDIPQILADLDISVLSSLTEALGLANMEAMLMGKPVVCFNVGGIHELVLDGKTGILVPSRNCKALASAIIDLIKDKDKAKRMGAEGQKRVKEDFSLAVMISEYEEMYKGLIK